MSDEFSFPGLALYEDDPNSRFLDLYNRFSGQFPEIGQYLQPNDPELLKYQELAGSPTGSEDLISSYIESMPEREEYEPSFGRKMIATLIGALSGDPTRAFSMARSEVQRPYTEAVSEWKMKGSNIASRARLMDTERQRQLQAMKYGLQTKAGTAKTQAQEEFRKLQEARRIADQVASEEKANKDAADREEERSFRRNMSERVFDMQKDMNEWRKTEAALDNTARDEARKAADADRAAKASSLEETNKHLSAYASQHGFDTSATTTALQLARTIAFQKAKQNPAFADLLEEVKDPNTGIISAYNTVPPSKYGGQERERILRLYIDNLTQKILRGDFNAEW